MLLKYDETRWEEINSIPVNTLQIFITNRCNLNCPGCFYKHRFAASEMILEQYQKIVEAYLDRIKKIVLLGGEPGLHNDLAKMVKINNEYGLKTTIYTNGHGMEKLNGVNLSTVSIRVDVKNYDPDMMCDLVFDPDLPFIMVFMMRMNNIHQLVPFAKEIEALGCKKLFISSIRDIHESKDFWKDTEDTVPLDIYAEVIQDFIDKYSGKMEISISRRGVITTRNISAIISEPNKCRFGNVFSNGDMITCPFDISKNILTDKLTFGERICNKHINCLLQKIVLRRK